MDATDPTALAIALAKQQGDLTVLQREVQVSIQNLTSTAHALQAELRHVGEQLADVARLQQQQVSHSEGLDRAFKAIEKLAQSFDSYRERSESNFDNWRERHESENRGTSDCVTEFRGQLRGVWMAGGVVVALVSALATLAWSRVNERFNDTEKSFADAKAERVRIEAGLQSAHNTDIARLQAQIDALRAKDEELEATRGAR